MSATEVPVIHPRAFQIREIRANCIRPARRGLPIKVVRWPGGSVRHRSLTHPRQFGDWLRPAAPQEAMPLVPSQLVGVIATLDPAVSFADALRPGVDRRFAASNRCRGLRDRSFRHTTTISADLPQLLRELNAELDRLREHFGR